MQKLKADRNKTIDFDLEEGRPYLERCLSLSAPCELEQAVNRTILGDSMQVLDYLPKKSVDLLFADPCYNLDKNFHGMKFTKLGETDYAQYTCSWVEKIIPLLKPTASIYVCCDWKTSMVIGNVLNQYFNVINRITWQREKGRGALTNWKNAMEDIWFATVSWEYTFNLDAVRQRRRVVAPYRVDGNPRDWQDTPEGKFRDTCPSNFWDDITVPYWSMHGRLVHTI